VPGTGTGRYTLTYTTFMDYGLQTGDIEVANPMFTGQPSAKQQSK
jgi:hypothetical protein